MSSRCSKRGGQPVVPVGDVQSPTLEGLGDLLRDHGGHSPDGLGQAADALEVEQRIEPDHRVDQRIEPRYGPVGQTDRAGGGADDAQVQRQLVFPVGARAFMGQHQAAIVSDEGHVADHCRLAMGAGVETVDVQRRRMFLIGARRQ